MRCRYHKGCSMFQKDSPTCTKDAGNYYGAGRPAGCFRKFQQKGEVNPDEV